VPAWRKHRGLRSADQMDKTDLIAFLLCDSVARDASSGKAIITGVFDRIWVPALPAAHPSMCAYFRFRVAGERPAQISIQIRFKRPSGIEQTSPPLPAMAGQNGIVEGSVNLQGFPIEEGSSPDFAGNVGGGPGL